MLVFAFVLLGLNIFYFGRRQFIQIVVHPLKLVKVCRRWMGTCTLNLRLPVEIVSYPILATAPRAQGPLGQKNKTLAGKYQIQAN